jgi:hypothetical protein
VTSLNKHHVLGAPPLPVRVIGHTSPPSRASSTAYKHAPIPSSPEQLSARSASQKTRAY